MSQFDTRFTRQTPVDSPDDTALSESANQAFLVRSGGLRVLGTQAGTVAGAWWVLSIAWPCLCPPGLHLRGALRPGQHQGGLLLPAQAALPEAPQQQPPNPHQVPRQRGACSGGRGCSSDAAVRPGAALAESLSWQFPVSHGDPLWRGLPNGHLTSLLCTQAGGNVGARTLVPGASR